jgi:hypothetical protein
LVVELAGAVLHDAQEQLVVLVLQAPELDRVVGAVEDVDVAVGVRVSDVSGAQPAVFVEQGCVSVLPDGACVPTVPIDQDSPATDAGSCAAASIAADARGVPRPFDLEFVADADDGCDTGAFEAIDADGDTFTEAADCAPFDATVHATDVCGVCGGDGSGCVIFSDGFESGDTSAW